MALSLGERIKYFRGKRGFSQDDMAQKLDMKRANFSSYETDRNIPPSNVLSKIADILGTSTDYLLGKTENPLPVDSTEREFLEALDLGDEELASQFGLKLDGKELTKEQIKMVVAFLRTLRQDPGKQSL